MSVNTQEAKTCGDNCESFDIKLASGRVLGNTGILRNGICRESGGKVREKSPCVIQSKAARGKGNS